MIVIYHIEGRRSERVAWLLEELGLPYELEFVQGDIVASLLALETHHEMRMTPIMRDGDLVMIESAAILEYILLKYGQGSSLRPAEDSPAFPRYLEFMHFSEGSALARIAADRQSAMVFKAKGVALSPPRLSGLAGSRTPSQRVMHFADNVLGERQYFAGDAFTAADIMMHMAMRAGAAIATDADVTIAEMYRTDHAYLDRFPNVKRFLIEMDQRPAYQRALRATLPNGPPAT